MGLQSFLADHLSNSENMDLENIGLRVGTIPVEDIFYGFDLILLNVTLYRLFQGYGAHSERDPS